MDPRSLHSRAHKPRFISPGEANRLLWDLRDGSYRFRRRFLEDVRLPSTIERLRQHSDVINHQRILEAWAWLIANAPPPPDAV